MNECIIEWPDWIKTVNSAKIETSMMKICFLFQLRTEPVRCAHRTQPIPCGVTVNVCWPMVWNVVFWRQIVWFPDQVYRCAKTIKLWSMWKITWKAWRRHCIGMVSISVVRSTTTVCHLWRSVPFSRATHSGKLSHPPSTFIAFIFVRLPYIDINGLATQVLTSGTLTLAYRKSTVSMAAWLFDSLHRVTQIRIYTISIWQRTLFWSATGYMKMPPNVFLAVWLSTLDKIPNRCWSMVAVNSAIRIPVSWQTHRWKYSQLRRVDGIVSVWSMHLHQCARHRWQSKAMVWQSLPPMVSPCIQFKSTQLFHFLVSECARTYDSAN